MYVDFSRLFHQSSKDRTGEGRVSIPLDSAAWPEDWKTLIYKDYPRLPSIELESGEHGHSAFFDTVESRRSGRDFDRRPIPAEKISAVLKHSCGIVHASETEHHRAQPSGGARYPIEAYILSFVDTPGIASGVYHYGVKAHELHTLWQRPFSEEDIATLFTYPWAKKASLALVLTGVFARNQSKYGERGYRQVLIEAGAIMQNAYLSAAALELQCCAIDGVHDRAVERLLDIDGITESFIVSLVLG